MQMLKKIFVTTTPDNNMHKNRTVLADRVIIWNIYSCVERVSPCGVGVYANTTSLDLEIRRLR